MEDIDSLKGWVAANLSIGEYIDGLNNSQHRHSALNHSGPIEFEPMPRRDRNRSAVSARHFSALARRGVFRLARRFSAVDKLLPK